MHGQAHVRGEVAVRALEARAQLERAVVGERGEDALDAGAREVDARIVFELVRGERRRRRLALAARRLAVAVDQALRPLVDLVREAVPAG